MIDESLLQEKFADQDLLASLKREGYFVLKDFITKEQLKVVLNEYDSVFNIIPDKTQAYLDTPNKLRHEPEGSYSSGKHLRLHKPAYPHFPNLISLFNNYTMKSISDAYCGLHNDYMMQIFMSYEHNVCENKEDWARNYWLHWDPYPALKYFLYLTDIDSGSAPTCFVPGTRKFGRECRKKMPLHSTAGWNNGTPNRLEDWHKDPKYTNSDAIPLYASAGTLLIFDTDLLHHGGLITEEGKERKVILVHNRPANLQMPVHD
tara:strand:- start:5529 stop:6311 length:783 start_codon:yes stop_codon:yes gene_type:complete